jgi:hypothetical protein
MPRPKHKRLQTVGDFEIWLSPSGEYEIYSPCALIAVRTTLAKAEAFAAKQVAA